MTDDACLIGDKAWVFLVWAIWERTFQLSK